MHDMTGATVELQAFLDLHGLGQYHAKMIAEDLDLATLQELDDADYKELGLTIGHRKLLRNALKAHSNARAGSDEAQRRQVTIFFCDLVGSTELSARYDAEDMAEILDRYHRHAALVIKRWGGLNLGTQGDGTVACFGYPKAAENDAERAVSAALEISRTVPELVFPDGLVLHTRIGVSTGRVFVRRKVADSSAIVGETVNMAARLQDSAPTDSVVVGNNTQRLIASSAQTSFLQNRIIKGFKAPVDIWLVTGIRDHADREDFLQAPNADTTLGLLGREEELAQISAIWKTAKTGAGQVIVVSGGAGIGKSHLIEAAKTMAQTDKANTIRYFCAPGYENSALYPIRGEISRRAGLRKTGDGVDVATKLANWAGSDDPATLRLLADFLAVDPGEALPALDMTAAQQKQATFALLMQQVQNLAATAPLLILLEDVHWADPTTLELLSQMVAQIAPANPILIILTQRPSQTVDLDVHEHVSQIKLDGLSNKHSRELVLRMMGDMPSSPEVLHQIIEAADGIPLFLEELSHSIMEQQDGLQGVSTAVRVPITLEDSLMARLDRLSKGKPFVQTAAVLGRHFETSYLRQVLGMEEEQFEAGLAEPVGARILLPASKTSDSAMLFRHALVHQAAYEGLARKQRQQLHERIANLLLEHQSGLAETEPETLARHFAGAGRLSEAVDYLIAAGKMATSRAAQIEATNHYLAALDHLSKLARTRQRDEQEVLLQALLGGALMATRGFAAPEVHDAFARARELCLSLGDSPMYCACLYGLFTVAASRSNKEEAMALATEMLTTFGECPVPSWAIAAHFTMGVAQFFNGKIDVAEHHFDHVIATYTPDDHVMLVEQFGDNLAEFSMCYRHWAHMMRGELDQSAAVLARAEELANQLNNKNAQTRSIAFRMGRLTEIGAVEEAGTLATDLVEIATVQGYPYWACAGQIGLGWSMAKRSDADGVAPIVGSLAFFDMIGQLNPQTYWRLHLIDAYIALGQRAEAVEAANFALNLSRTGLDSAFEAGILLRRGQARLLGPADPVAAEQDLRAGLEISLRMGTHFYSFQIALVLAQLLITQGRQTEEAGMLAATMARIQSSTDLPALAQARQVLAHL